MERVLAVAKRLSTGLIQALTLDDNERLRVNTDGNTGGYTARALDMFVRPNDANIYAALDAVSDSTTTPLVLSFLDVARANGGSGYITKARLVTTQTTCVARFRLHLFSTPPTPINDNAPYTLLWANYATRIGEIDFLPCNTEGAGSTAAKSLNSTIRLAFVCAADRRHLYGLLETLDAFTPAALQDFYVELTAEQN